MPDQSRFVSCRTRAFWIQIRGLKVAAISSAHVRLAPSSVLDDPEVVGLMNTALYRANVPIDPKAKRKLIIKSISAKQRPRRPLHKTK